MKAILLTASFVGFVAAGQTFVVLIGGIDLSVPWVLNGAAILFVTTSLGRDSRTWWALPLTLGMGLAVGMCNGLAVAFLAVPGRRDHACDERRRAGSHARALQGPHLLVVRVLHAEGRHRQRHVEHPRRARAGSSSGSASSC